MRDTAGFVFIRVHRRVQIAGQTTLQKNMHLVNALDLITDIAINCCICGPSEVLSMLVSQQHVLI